jgi:hypothetical protein
MTEKTTTIALRESTRNELFQRKDTPEDTYDEVIQSLIEREQ